MQSTSERGSSLVEVLVATSLMATALVGLAHLFAQSTKHNIGARSTTFATVLAEQKMEQLRSLTWGFDTLGLPLSDTTTNLAATVREDSGFLASRCAQATTGLAAGLSPSPADTLRTNTDGYVDYVDANGCVLGGGGTPPPGTAYVRRWSVEPLPTNPNNTLILQVLVTRRADRSDSNAAVSRLPDEARLVSVKTRKTT